MWSLWGGRAWDDPLALEFLESGGTREEEKREVGETEGDIVQSRKPWER